MSDVRKLKEGEIMRYKDGFFSGKFKKNYAVLMSDSTLQIYDEKGDRKPKVSLFLKDVVPYMCVGMVCDRMPVRRPQLPSGFSVHHLVGIGMDPSAEEVHWLLFASDAVLESWFNEIVKTLPKPNPPPQDPEQQNADGGFVPPPKNPNEPPPPYSAGPSRGPPQCGPNGQPTTVVVNQGGQQGGYDNGLGGLGTGLLLGTLAGYGMGSFFGGPMMMMGGYGMGGAGFGSYYSDNDTTTVNNYYNGDGGDAAGGDYDGADDGGGDFGDFGGGDFGGDFGGGDFGF